ncbi:MAG: hypothetical protein OER88_05600 [Planctomycetota bacterium]|nr:hypothetical protein [Planctomycetota bacterium]
MSAVAMEPARKHARADWESAWTSLTFRAPGKTVSPKKKDDQCGA